MTDSSLLHPRDEPTVAVIGFGRRRRRRSIVFSILFIVYSCNTGAQGSRSVGRIFGRHWGAWTEWMPFVLAGVALLLVIPVYRRQRSHLTEPKPVPPYRWAVSPNVPVLEIAGSRDTSGFIEFPISFHGHGSAPGDCGGVAFERLAWLLGWDQICVSQPAVVL
jgi:hypothetical protein